MLVIKHTFWGTIAQMIRSCEKVSDNLIRIRYQILKKSDVTILKNDSSCLEPAVFMNYNNEDRGTRNIVEGARLNLTRYSCDEVD